MQTYQIIVGLESDRHQAPIPAAPTVLADWCHRIAAKYGGYSLVCGKGGWIDGHGNLIEERNAIVTIFSEDAYAPQTITDDALGLGRDLNQSAVVVVTDARPRFLPIAYAVITPVA